MSDMVTWNVEYTDTFGGDANYSWVRRDDIEMSCGASERAIMRKAKAAMGISGMRGRTYWHGDSAEFRPYRSCTVMFVQFDYR